MDPISVVTTISAGLGLVDRFYDLTKKILGQKPTSHSVQVRKDKGSIVIEERGNRQEIRASELRLSEFDQLRHDTLKRKIDLNWNQYNSIDEEIVVSAADEKARLQLKRDRIKGELCRDFRELVSMYERIIGRRLPDHYTLHDICT
jgi:hypothetical protein